MFTNIAITKARINLGSLVKNVLTKNDRYILEKDGLPVAAVVDLAMVEEFQDLQDFVHFKKTDDHTRMTLAELKQEHGL